MKLFGLNITKAQAKKIKSRPARSNQTVQSAEAAHTYTMFGHRVADLANEQGLGGFRQTGDSASRYDRDTMVNLTRQVNDENIIFSSIIERMTVNLVGADGFGLQARTGDKATNELIEKEIWPEFTENPEYRELFTWTDVQSGVCRDMIGVGDIGFAKLRNGQLQAIESEWINDPARQQVAALGVGRKVEQGVEMTLGGKVLGFWHNPPSMQGYASYEGTRIDKRDFIYVHGDIQRFSRTRPLPPFIQTMSCIWRLDDILNSEALCWQLLARMAFMINKEGADEDAYDDGEVDQTYEHGDITDRLTDIGTGLIFHGRDGEKVAGVDRNLPGKDFPSSVRAFLQLFGMRVGLPLEVLMLDWSKTNFSSGKAALTQSELSIRKWQRAMVLQFHKPVYEWRIRRAIEEGRLEETPDIYAHEWFPPTPPWIDAKEEAESWGIRVDRGLVTFSDALKSQGKDRAEENQRRREDIEAAIKIANEIQEATGIKVDWKLFAGYLVGKTENAVRESNGQDEPDEPDDDNEMEPETDNE